MPAKQEQLPGVGPKRIPELEDAAEALRALRTQRQALAAKEEEAQQTLRQTLRDLCKAHKVTKARPYIFETEEGEETIKLDVLVEKPEERAYVRKHREPKQEDEDGEDDPTD